MNRAPFDLAEAESELVAGFHTEYSGLRWSYFFMAEYGSMFAVSGLAAVLFFGGWNGPVPVADLLGLSTEPERRGCIIAATSWAVNFILKAVVGVTVMMWVRWTLPRLRIDQVIKTCWKYCTPIAAAMFVGVISGRRWASPAAARLLPLDEARKACHAQYGRSATTSANRTVPLTQDGRGHRRLRRIESSLH